MHFGFGIRARDPFGRRELAQLGVRQRLPSLTQGRFRAEALKQRFDFFERKTVLLRESQNIDSVDRVRIVTPLPTHA
jgi:hypothetical protein